LDLWTKRFDRNRGSNEQQLVLHRNKTVNNGVPICFHVSPKKVDGSEIDMEIGSPHLWQIPIWFLKKHLTVMSVCKSGGRHAWTFGRIKGRIVRKLLKGRRTFRYLSPLNVDS